METTGSVPRKVEEELLRSKNELERISKELALANSLLGATLESISEGILVVDFVGQVAFHNSVFQSMWGLDWKFLFKGADGRALIAELAGRTTTPEFFQILVADAFSNAASYSPAKFLLKDGRTFRVHLVIRSLRPGLSGLVLQFSDITDEIRGQNEIRQASLFFEANQG
ncbi:MAG: PAS-domain containing protein, partial [Spirochaetia bacterium]|nr:PAS-domain containing protein [Spirochaetia bacterium]